MMESGLTLEKSVQDFCKANNKDEGDIWQIINRIHAKRYGIDVMNEKHKYESDNNLPDVPMSQFFAIKQMVNHAMKILTGLENCIINNWPLE